MAKLENYVELARQTMREISADGETWRSFLQTASTLYIIVNFGHFIAPPSLSQHNAQARSAGFIQLHHDRTVILLARLGNHALD